MRSLPIALAAAIAAATVSLACSQDEEAVPPDVTVAPTAVAASPTPATKGQLWRWGNVTVVIPEGADVAVAGGGGFLEITAGLVTDRPASLQIDAQTGEIIKDDIPNELRGTVDQILASLRISPRDPSTAPWPYNGQMPSGLPKERIENVEFVRPDPSSGIAVSGGVAEGGIGFFIEIRNSRSVVFVQTSTGQVLGRDRIVPDDVGVFDRYLASIKVCSAVAPC